MFILSLIKIYSAHKNSSNRYWMIVQGKSSISSCCQWRNNITRFTAMAPDCKTEVTTECRRQECLMTRKSLLAVNQEAKAATNLAGNGIRTSKMANQDRIISNRSDYSLQHYITSQKTQQSQNKFKKPKHGWLCSMVMLTTSFLAQYSIEKRQKSKWSYKHEARQQVRYRQMRFHDNFPTICKCHITESQGKDTRRAWHTSEETRGERGRRDSNGSLTTKLWPSAVPSSLIMYV